MDQKKMWLLPGVLIILVILSAGCTSSTTRRKYHKPTDGLPRGCHHNTNTFARYREYHTSTTTIRHDCYGNPSTRADRDADDKTHPVPYDVFHLRLRRKGTQIFPLSFDDQGVITKGNITISGVIQSLSSYPLQVVMRGEIIGAYPPSLPRATAYETVTITPHGISGFMLEMDDYVFNYRPIMRSHMNPLT